MSAVERVEKLNVWFPEKHYGFLHQERDGELVRIFLHEKNIMSGVPRTGARVRFKVVMTSKGLMAIDATIIPEGEGNGGAR
jgi:cold shock CspA family protein